MITLQSIRVRNFRSIREATFKPLEQGITGIFGANGAGKTTFLSAVVWALFGTLPPEGNVTSLRREGSTGECSVSVLFRHNGQQIEVIRELKGKANSSVVTVYVDGVVQAEGGITEGTNWIKKRLGIDSVGFETAFVIKQKELDNLVRAKPTERKAIIERLAGIDTITAALKKARETANVSKKALEGMPGSERAIQETETLVNLLSDKLEQQSVDREAIFAEHQRLARRAREVGDILDSLRETEIKLNRDSDRLQAYSGERAQLNERLEQLSYLDELTGNASDTLADLRRQHQELTASLNSLTAERNDVQSRHQTALAELGRAEKNAAEAQHVLDSLPEVTATAEDLTAELGALTTEAETLRNRVAVLRSQNEGWQTSIGMLGHSAECPTCHTHLDDTHALLTQWQQFIDANVIEITEAGARITEIQERQRQVRDDMETLASKAEATATLSLLQESIPALRSAPEELAERGSTLAEEIRVLAERRDRVTELGAKARTESDDRAARKQVQERLVDISKDEKRLQGEIKAAKAAMGESNTAELRVELNKVQHKLDELSPKLEAASGERSQTEARLAVARNNYTSAKDQWKRRQERLRENEELGYVTSKLEKFRADTVASLAPELSEHATGLISEMTNGEFTEIRLDNDFNPSVVTNEGNERPVGWLSGGELSAVALALRIAIGYLITGGNPELLWLDEVLTAQDADRRAAMLALIRSLPIDQIVMINHTADAQDIVDKTVTLKIDRKNGSYIADAE